MVTRQDRSSLGPNPGLLSTRALMLYAKVVHDASLGFTADKPEA